MIHRRRNQATCRAAGFTLAEVTMSIAIISVLFLAMGTVWLFAARSMDSSVVASEENKAERVVAQIISEIRFAESIMTPNGNTFVLQLPDRDGDGNSEFVTYRHTPDGAGSGCLTRSYNGGAEVVVLDDAPQIALSSMFRTVSPVRLETVPTPNPTAWGYFVSLVDILQIGIAVDGQIRIFNSSFIDSYDSGAGAYGGANIGSAAAVATNSEITNSFETKDTGTINGDAYCGPNGLPANVISNGGTITGSQAALAEAINMPNNGAPTGMPASIGNANISTDQTWSSDLTFGSLTLKDTAVITVTGNIRVHVTGNFDMTHTARLVINPGCSVTFYFKKRASFDDNTVVNASDSPESCKLIAYGNSGIDLKQGAQVSALIECTSQAVSLDHDTHFYGSILADELFMWGNAQIHMDVKNANLAGF